MSLIEGCSLLVYLVDVGTFLTTNSGRHSSAEATGHFACQLGMLHQELELFNPRLVDGTTNTSLVIGTKIDLVVPPSGGQETLRKISACLSDAAKQAGLQSPQILLISARRGDNIEGLVEILANMHFDDK